MDKKGRLVIPRKLREELNISGECYVELTAEGDKIILKPVKSIADNYFGVLKAKKWSEDLDEFLSREVVKRWSEGT